MKNKRTIGARYEQKAKEYLVKNGYEILISNFYTRNGEIDIIAKDKEYICFVEVKYRTGNTLLAGFEAVDSAKQKKIISVSKYYLYKNHLNENETLCRYDVVSIDNDDIKLIKNAFP